jgi:hypothetical protein
MTDRDVQALDRRVRSILSVVDECRRLMVDLPIEDKLLAVERLVAWTELERRDASERIQ